MIPNVVHYTKDGICYLAHPKIERVREVQLQLAEEVKRICSKYDISYFIIWGTLLGAERNAGFIPWDDDFDIALFRDDYTKFIKVAPKEIAAPFFLQTALTDRQYYFPYARMRNSKTTGIIVENYSADYNNGIFIDIYPLDAIPSCQMLRGIKFWLRDNFYWVCSNYYMSKSSGTSSIMSKVLARFFEYEFLCSCFDHICKIGNRIDGKVVGLAYHKVLAKTYKFTKKYAQETRELPFEGHSFAVPTGYKRILAEVYGDYMKIPPKRKRGRWHEGQIIYDPDISYIDYIRGEKHE